MRWRRIITITALLCAILIIVGVVVLKTYDFNRFKPMIVSAVSDAIGRQRIGCPWIL